MEYPRLLYGCPQRRLSGGTHKECVVQAMTQGLEEGILLL